MKLNSKYIMHVWWYFLFTLYFVFKSYSCQEMHCCSPQFLTASLFPNIPPTIKFTSPISHNHANNSNNNCSLEQLTQCKSLLGSIPWRKYKVCPLTKEIINHSGLTLPVEKEKTGSAKNRKSPDGGLTFNAPHQKYNHLPNIDIFQNKNLLSQHCVSASNKLAVFAPKNNEGQRSNSFCPTTFNLPAELESFLRVWRSNKGEEEEEEVWILKPSRGKDSIGVEIITNTTQLQTLLAASNPTNKYVIQTYVLNPITYEDKKTEFRYLVLISSTLPLRAYTFEYAFNLSPSNYSNSSDSFTNNCIHSRWTKPPCHETKGKKKKDYFIHSENVFQELWSQEERDKIKTRINEITLSILLQFQSTLWSSSIDSMKNRYNAYKVFSFDFLIDVHLNVWFLEINSNPGVFYFHPMPSTNGEKGRRRTIDSYGYMTEVFNIVGYQLSPFTKAYIPSNYTFNAELYTFSNLSRIEMKKQAFFIEWFKKFKTTTKTEKEIQNETKAIADAILSDLTADDVKLLLVTQDELNRAGEYFKPIVPTTTNQQVATQASLLLPDYIRRNIIKFYIDMVEQPQALYYLILVEAWELQYGISKAQNKKGIGRLASLIQKYKL